LIAGFTVNPVNFRRVDSRKCSIKMKIKIVFDFVPEKMLIRNAVLHRDRETRSENVTGKNGRYLSHSYSYPLRNKVNDKPLFRLYKKLRQPDL
jgi:hypothetical protein